MSVDLGYPTRVATLSVRTGYPHTLTIITNHDAVCFTHFSIKPTAPQNGAHHTAATKTTQKEGRFKGK